MSYNRQPDFILYSLLVLEVIFINSIAVSLHLMLTYIDTFQQLTLLVGINLSWFTAAIFMNSYKISNLIDFGNIVLAGLKTSIIHMTSVTFIYSYACNTPFPRKIFTVYILVTFTIFILSRFLFMHFLRRVKNAGYSFKNAYIVGNGLEAKRLKKFFNSSHSFGVKFKGYFVEPDKVINNTDVSLYDTCAEVSKLRVQESHVAGTLSDLEEQICSGKIDYLYWSLPQAHDKSILHIIDLCERYMVRFYRVPGFASIPFRNLDVESYDGLPVIQYRKEPLESNFNRLVKRSFDIAFASTVSFFVLTWLIPLIWLITKFTMPGPLFFTQERTGLKNRKFKVLKFRSMRINNQADSTQATRGDERITFFGAFMRKYSIDEMPQFLNVLKGDMTVVGPRPHMLKHTEEYSQLINNFMVRHLIKPGITGWAQVSGYRGGTEEIRQMQGRVEHDVWYIENWSFWLDIKITLKTVTNALSGEEKAY